MALLITKDDIDFAAYRHETDGIRNVRAAAEYLDDMIDDIGKGTADPGECLPWGKTAGLFKFRPGDVTLWAGPNGHGKSLVTGMVALDLVCALCRVCIASFEMRPRKTLGRMCRQFVDSFRPTPQQVKAFVAWGQGRMWVYDQTGTVEPAKVYAVIRYAADKLKVTHFVVDNLTKMVASDDDYAGQKAIVDKLTSLALALNIHIHLVHHARKDRDETRPPRKMDALGASAITNLVDNVFIVWKNKAKAESDHPDENKPDAMFICDKQRHGTGWEGLLSLAYHSRSQQFIEHGTYEAMPFAVPNRASENLQGVRHAA